MSSEIRYLIAGGEGNGSSGDGEVERVEDEEARRAEDIENDADSAGEGAIGEVRLEGEIIAFRDCEIREASTVLELGKRFHGEMEEHSCGWCRRR